MRCCVPFCKSRSDSGCSSDKAVSFHGFPREVHLRAAWLRALGKQDGQLPDSALVCELHFLDDETYDTESGVRQIVSGAIPVTVQVCMMCLDTDSKLLSMNKHRLREAYQKLTGQPMCDQGNLKRTLCVQCAHRLMNFSRFRDKILRAHALMTDLVEKHELITRRHIKMINRTEHLRLQSNMVSTTLGPDHYDLHILEHAAEDNQIKLEETVQSVVVKIEKYDESMSVDEDLEVVNEYGTNVNDFVHEPVKHESIYRCTFCLEEFMYKDAYMQHTCMGLQNGDRDGGHSASQVSELLTTVSCTSTHVTAENKPDLQQLTEGQSCCKRELQTSATHLPSTDEDDTKEAQANVSCCHNELKDCFVKLIDIIKHASKFESKNMSPDYSNQKTDQNEIYATYFDGTNGITAPMTSENDRHYLNEEYNLKDSAEDVEKLNEKVYFKCEICGKLFKRKSYLSNHIKSHIVRQFACKVCQYKCKYESALRSHMLTHTGEKPYQCNLCTYKSAKNSHLTEHMRTHTGEKPYQCKLCTYKSAYSTDLVKHTRTHASEKQYNCKLCPYKCATDRHLAEHLRTHTGETPYHCKLCTYKCATKRQLANHIRGHTGEKPFHCKLCTYKTAYSTDLVKHVRIHTGERPYHCKLCPYKCATNTHLAEHIRTHTGEKPYHCKLCTYKSTNNTSLVKHMRTHTGEKPYHCKICTYKCKTSSHLVKHMRTHTGEKPYTCKICNKSFARNVDARHMRTHTGESSVS